MKKLILFGVCILFVGCTTSNPERQWNYSGTIALDGINPIGLTATKQGLWMSDGDHNRIALIDERGGIVEQLEGLDRPMHIASDGDAVYIPQYGNDQVLKWTSNDSIPIQLRDSLDAPAGVSVWKDQIAIADFYNHRVLYFNGQDWTSIGKEGKEEGEFYYPTDVQITEGKIWVADAYNNRGQVFDTKGNFQFVFGKEEKFNAATGIYVSQDQVFLTDFENDRVLIFTHTGALVQILDRAIEKPTDLMVWKDNLYITNYRKGEVIRYD